MFPKSTRKNSTFMKWVLLLTVGLIHLNPSQSSCEKLRHFIRWEADGCALLFEEKACGHCWFRPTLLRDGESIRPGRRATFLSQIVRPGCIMTNNQPSIRRLYAYRKHSGIFQYDPSDRDFNVKNSFLPDEESVFSCECDCLLDTRTTTSSSPKTASNYA